MLDFYNSLSEKDRRRYAAIEATKLGYGGATYICSLLQCDDWTITEPGVTVTVAADPPLN